jgi:hypothetical protein
MAALMHPPRWFGFPGPRICTSRAPTDPPAIVFRSDGDLPRLPLGCPRSVYAMRDKGAPCGRRAAKARMSRLVTAHC